MYYHAKIARCCSQMLLGLGAWGGLAAAAHAAEIQVAYRVAAGATSAPIAIPAANTPVSMTCVQNNVGFHGVGQATVLRVSPPTFLEWVGIDLATGTNTHGVSSTAGTHIIWCSFTTNEVDIQVQSATDIQVHNANTSLATGVINFVW
jgi:hypothetical protein